MSPEPTPFKLNVPDEDIKDLRDRLSRTRFPDQDPGEEWETGTPVSALKRLVDRWKNGFDWRGVESRLNELDQFEVEVAGAKVHYLHVKPKAGKGTPLLLMHGWPGSVLEFLDILPMLTEPEKWGGRTEDAFEVIAPSLPGYALSYEPGKRYGTEEMADIFAKLMSKLGFERFAVQGGDWGASIGSRLGYAYPERLIGIHLNFLAAVRRDPSRWINGTAEERAYAATLGRFIHSGTGYAVIQGTKPMSLAAALVDSPSGLLAWIAEKFYAWSDAPGIDDDKVLSCVSWYWFTGCAGASMWPYYVRHNRGWPIPEGKTIDAPVGYAEFPKEINRPPKTVAAEMYTNIRRWTTMESGGHFAALERPKELAAEIRAFFAELRSQAHGHPI